MSYARARLWTGITAVGGAVVVASLAIATGAPQRLLGGAGGTFGSDAVALLALSGALAIALLPLDVLGGWILPRAFGRQEISPARFVAVWLRGVAAMAVLGTGVGSVLLVAGRSGGRPLAGLAFVVLAFVLLTLQEPLARFVGGLRRVDGSGGNGGPDGSGGPGDSGTDREAGEFDDVIWLAGGDPGFCGGFTRSLGSSWRIVLPAHWRTMFQRRALELLVERRRSILTSGAWRLTLWIAVLWNTTGFLVATLLPGAGVGTVAELVTTAIGFTLWTFLGLLALPAASRRATVAADSRVVPDGERPQRLQNLGDALGTLDSLQDDEPERSPGLESVFHPVPAVANRMRALAGARSGTVGAWHLARTSLFLSNVGLSPLARLVHCNVGRPELWVYLPTDG